MRSHAASRPSPHPSPCGRGSAPERSLSANERGPSNRAPPPKLLTQEELRPPIRALQRQAADPADEPDQTAPERPQAPLQRRRLALAVIASALVGLTVDSIVFLSLAFGSLAFLPGQIVGKAWAVLVSIPLVRVMRRVAPTPA